MTADQKTEISDSSEPIISVQQILRDYPRLVRFIERAESIAEEMFPGSPLTVSLGKYPDDEPLVGLVHVYYPEEDFLDHARAFNRRIHSDPDFDAALIAIIPVPEPGMDRLTMAR